jgi:site-specific recombinase XerD
MDQLVSDHLDFLAMKGRRPNSITYRRRALARMQQALGGVPVADATTADMARWRASLTGLSDAAVIAYVAQARSWYDWLVRTGYRADNPCADLPVPPSPEYRPRPVSEDDLYTALAGASGRLRAWLVLGGWCGLRCIEIACLRRNCVRDRDPQPGIRIAPDATKGGRHGRFIPLTGADWVLDELADAGLPASGWCFPRLDGLPGHVSAHLVSQVCCNYLHSLGIPDTMHSLRHRFGTRLLSSPGANTRVVQEALGHRHLSTVAAYTLVENAEIAAAIAAIPVPGRKLRQVS